MESEFQQLLQPKLKQRLLDRPEVSALAVEMLREIEVWYSEGGPDYVYKKLKEKVLTTLSPYRQRLDSFKHQMEEEKET